MCSVAFFALPIEFGAFTYCELWVIMHNQREFGDYAREALS